MSNRCVRVGIWFALAICFALSLVACTPGGNQDDDQDDNQPDDDQSPDDDASDDVEDDDIFDDDTVDDDMVDDDAVDDDTADDDSVDDDSVDDDSVDDDAVDDDTVDDDTVDDDTIDDDTIDDDSADDDTAIYVTGVQATTLLLDGLLASRIRGLKSTSNPNREVAITYLDGGAFGHYGLGLASTLAGAGGFQPLAEKVSLHALATDGAGHLHVAYVDSAMTGLWYGTNASGVWEYELVTAYESIVEVDLAADSDGWAHIVCTPYEAETSSVIYWTNRGGTWEDTLMAGDYSRLPAIALDPQDNVHLIYNDSANAMHYATHINGGWEDDVLAYPNWFFVAQDLAVDGNGAAHIAVVDAVYGMVQNVTIYHFNNIGGIWKKKRVMHTTSYSAWITEISIATDSQAQPHIAYGNSDQMIYTTPVGGEWPLITVESLVSPQYPRLLIASGDKVYLGYYQQAKYGSKVVRKTGDDWPAVLDYSGGDTAFFVHLALDAAGHRHVCYFDMAAREMRYATDAGGAWSVETVDTDLGGSSASYASAMLAVDEDGAAHISYPDFRHSQLKYATNAGGAWQPSVVAATDNDDIYSAIIVGDGAVYLAYLDLAQNRLVYATNDGGGWISETAFEGGLYPDNLDLALIDGQPIISFSRYQLTHAQLALAKKVGDEWTIEMVDENSENRTLISPSMAPDADGGLHLTVAYWDLFQHGVAYYEKVAENWVRTEVSPNYEDLYPWSTDIAVDGDGYIHITYTDDYLNSQTGDNLCYITNCGGLWETTALVTEGYVGQFNSLAVHPAGQVDIAYGGEHALWFAEVLDRN